DADGPVLARGRELRAIGAEADPQNSAGMPGEGPGQFAGREIPDLGDPVGPRRGESRAVGTEGQPPDRALMPGQSGKDRPGRDAPDPNLLVCAGGCDPGAIRADREAEKCVGEILARRITGERPDQGSLNGIPELDGAVATGGGQTAAAGAEGDCEHPVRMARDGEQQSAGAGIPDPDRVVEACRGEAGALRGGSRGARGVRV